MATTDEILAAAKKLGALIATHPDSVRLGGVLKKLEGDTEAQRLLLDYHRQLGQIAEDEAQGKPIEVEQKHAMESLQGRVVRDETLREYQIAQMNYLDLMRRVDQAISGQTGSLQDAPAAG